MRESESLLPTSPPPVLVTERRSSPVAARRLRRAFFATGALMLAAVVTIAVSPQLSSTQVEDAASLGKITAGGGVDTTINPDGTDIADLPGHPEPLEPVTATEENYVTVYQIFGGYNSQFIYDFLQEYIAPLVPEGTQMVFSDQVVSMTAFVNDWLLKGEVDAGSIVIFESSEQIASRYFYNNSNFNNSDGSGDLMKLDPSCLYTFTSSSPLLSEPNVIDLLSVDTPLILMDTGDVACRTHYPSTIHKIWRSSYSSDMADFATYMPFGVQFDNKTQFAEYAKVARKKTVWKRDFAMFFAGAMMYRKPVREYVNHTMYEGGVLEKLKKIASAQGQEIIWDLDGGNEKLTYQYYNHYGLTADSTIGYLEAMQRSRLYLFVPGDVWEGGDLWQAIEMGVIPVIEQRPDYKGCKDPAGYFRETQAPVFLIDSWEDLPDLLQQIVDDGDDQLEKRRMLMMKWWDDQKADIASQMIIDGLALKNLDKSDWEENDCTVEELTDYENDALNHQTSMFFRDFNWVYNYHDSPWIPGPWCTKKDVDLSAPRTHGTDVECFSPKCAGPRFRSLTCNGETVEANLGNLWKSGAGGGMYGHNTAARTDNTDSKHGGRSDGHTDPTEWKHGSSEVYDKSSGFAPDGHANPVSNIDPAAEAIAWYEPGGSYPDEVNVKTAASE